MRARAASEAMVADGWTASHSGAEAESCSELQTVVLPT